MNNRRIKPFYFILNYVSYIFVRFVYCYYVYMYSVRFSDTNITSNILYNQGNFPIKIFCGTENKTKDKRAGGSFVQRKLNLKIGFMHLARYYKFFFSPSFPCSPLELFQCCHFFSLHIVCIFRYVIIK